MDGLDINIILTTKEFSSYSIEMEDGSVNRKSLLVFKRVLEKFPQPNNPHPQPPLQSFIDWEEGWGLRD